PPPPPTSPPQLPTSPPPPIPPARITSVRSDESLEEEDRQRKETEETATFEELEAEIMRISRSPVPPPVISIPPPPPNIPIPPTPHLTAISPPSPRPTSVPPPIPSPGHSEDVNVDELIESISDSVIISSMSPPPPLPPLRESSLEEETAEKTPEDPQQASQALPVDKPEDRPKAPTPVRDSSLPPPPPPPKPETPLAIRRGRAGPIPTPQLLEMIHQEECARPSSPTVSSSSTPHSRPQSPAVPKIISIQHSFLESIICIRNKASGFMFDKEAIAHNPNHQINHRRKLQDIMKDITIIKEIKNTPIPPSLPLTGLDYLKAIRVARKYLIYLFLFS
uniref:Uncharacterized protein n=1 Tax=Caenorhabditis japonica TaxID=281687 RepID=A0A8R1EMI4_CAEJA